MVIDALIWSIPAGIIHFIILGALYGNPLVDRIYTRAQETEPGVRKWDSKPRYLITQFLGTQVEVLILVYSYLWLRSQMPVRGVTAALYLGLMFAFVRVFPRFWNMWIQSTYPMRLLLVEACNGTIGTLLIICCVELFV